MKCNIYNHSLHGKGWGGEAALISADSYTAILYTRNSVSVLQVYTLKCMLYPISMGVQDYFTTIIPVTNEYM